MLNWPCLQREIEQERPEWLLLTSAGDSELLLVYTYQQMIARQVLILGLQIGFSVLAGKFPNAELASDENLLSV